MSLPESAFILNVDDTAASLYVKSKMLQQRGHTVVEARTGAEALQLAAEKLPDLVVLDIKLPDITGWEVCRRLKADSRTGAIPVLQVSATFTEPGHTAVGLMSGADEYLIGPVDEQQFLNTVQTLIDRRRRQAP
jgi:CheY-like chemotaxis protein